ncbi:antifreeze protein [Pholiota molesta]|nr:antifreeze protein [Pholiota molesta]
MSPITFLKLASIALMSVSSCLAAGPAAVALGAAGNFAILGSSGISSVPPSAVLGNVGISPAASTFVTGFSLILSPTGTFSSSTQVTGQVLASDYKSPTPATLITSVNAVVTAFNDAKGRINPTATGLGAGGIGGLTFAPGLYKWTTGVNIASDITISGTSLDTWIFQVAGTLNTASAVKVTLAGGALPKNIVWVVSGAVTIGTTSVVSGIILGATSITLNTGATVNGRLLSQTAVALGKATVNAPAV